MLPRYIRVTNFLRKHGVDIIWLDSDGNIEVPIPLLIEAGVTCIWPLEVAAEMDPIKIRREYGHDLALTGRIDKRETAKDETAIEREVMSKIPELVADGLLRNTREMPTERAKFENLMMFLLHLLLLARIQY